MPLGIARERVVPVILAGGQGALLWPLSRTDRLKQFQRLFGDLSLFQQTVLRVHGKPGFEAPVIVACEAHQLLIEEQLSEIGVHPGALILEPLGRNTACAIALAAVVIKCDNLGDYLLAMPSDHIIGNKQVLLDGIDIGLSAAPSSSLVAFGIEPKTAATEYGYIQVGAALYRDGRYKNGNAYVAKQFVEKPAQEKADEFLSNGAYLWNSGIFLFPVKQILAELKRLKPDLLNGVTAALYSGEIENRVITPLAGALREVENISIDHAVMEHSKLTLVVPLDLEWSDIGSWSVLWEIDPANTYGNVTFGDIQVPGVMNSCTPSEDASTAVIDCQDVTVVTAEDVTEIATKDRERAVGPIVESLLQDDDMKVEACGTVIRPWGRFQTLDHGDGFQVKRITVSPGQSLSLQLHRYRSEHWTVVSGEASVIVGDQMLRMKPNESVYIPVGDIHRLENPGMEPVELIEVQCGSYLGEDDIVRLEDVYGRVA